MWQQTCLSLAGESYSFMMIFPQTISHWSELIKIQFISSAYNTMSHYEFMLSFFFIFFCVFLLYKHSQVSLPWRVQQPANKSSVAWSGNYLQSQTNQSDHQQTGGNLETTKRVDLDGNPLKFVYRRAFIKCFVPQRRKKMHWGGKKWIIN